MTHIERLQQNGIRRLRKGKRGFEYRTEDGRKVSKADVSRIKALGIPPAWTEVAINRANKGRLQAIGKDAAGRWQYIYHSDHVRKQERKKFDRLIRFGEGLPALRKAIAGHLRQSSLTRERVVACILKIVAHSFMRPGNETYANENGSYGIASLQNKHMSVKGDLIVFDFPGKSGVQQHREIRSRPIARVVRELRKLPGRRVFHYETETETPVKVMPAHVNAYIKDAMGDNFTAKDFRTWAGTLICASALARAGNVKNGNSTSKQRVKYALQETADALGNTPAVCRSAYVCPSILTRFDKDQVVRSYLSKADELARFKGTSLHPAERALLRFLKQKGE